ncbi:hypothetical protein BDW69DRAFT_177021 [Aspergillus filifer]
MGKLENKSESQVSGGRGVWRFRNSGEAEKRLRKKEEINQCWPEAVAYSTWLLHSYLLFCSLPFSPTKTYNAS